MNCSCRTLDVDDATVLNGRTSVARLLVSCYDSLPDAGTREWIFRYPAGTRPMWQAPFSIDQLHSAEFEQRALQLSPDARKRVECIRFYLEPGHSIALTCRRFSIARGSLCRWLERFNPADLTTLEERSHKPKTVRQPRVAPAVVELIRGYRKASSLIGKETIAMLLQQHHKVMLSSSTIGRVIDRECLYFGDTPLHCKKRLEHWQSVTLHTPPALPAEAPQSSVRVT